jgi:hypothetical protein
MIPTPEYKGKWVRPMIDNADYKGEWKPRQIDNPDFFVEVCPRAWPDLAGIASSCATPMQFITSAVSGEFGL